MQAIQPIHTALTHWLVAVSVLTSIMASYAAFSFADRVAESKGAPHYAWLGSGALAMGLGIWSMHYLGMLSVQLPVDIFYHVPTVLLSLALAVLASVVVLVVVSKERLAPLQIATGSVLMGGGIGLMHYTGMHAMRSTLMHRYNLRLVLVSVVVAVVFSWIALWIAFFIRTGKVRREWLRLVGAALMGCGIAAMHYTAMTAVSFMPGGMAYSTVDTIRLNNLGVVAVALTTGFVLFGALITTLLDRQVYEQLSAERDRLQAVTDATMDALFICAAVRGDAGDIEDFRFTYLNKNVAAMVAIPLDQLLGARMCEVLPINRALGLFERYKQVVLTGEPLVHEFAIDDKDVISGWLRIQAVKLRDGVAICASDITSRKRKEEQILRLAHHDPLTGLVNRSLLADRLGQAMERAKRHNNKVAVFLIDLDNFKRINDTLGHAAGDAVLIAVANRLGAVVRASDSIVRIGGDEFVAIFPDVGALSNVHACAKKIFKSFQPPVPIDGLEVYITCSLGIAVYPDSAIAVEALLSKADAAMYIAKNRGKNQYEVFSDELPEPETVEIHACS